MASANKSLVKLVLNNSEGVVYKSYISMMNLFFNENHWLELSADN